MIRILISKMVMIENFGCAFSMISLILPNTRWEMVENSVFWEDIGWVIDLSSFSFQILQGCKDYKFACFRCSISILYLSIFVF